MPQKKLFAALLVAASALLMLGMSNENQIPYPSNYDTKSAGASSYNGPVSYTHLTLPTTTLV